MNNQQPQMPSIVLQQMQPPPMPRHFNGVVPPRYDAAMRYLEYCHVKEMTRPVANDIAIDQVPGLELTVDEQIVRRTACRTIHKYLRGELPVDTWEWLTWRHDYIETVRMLNGQVVNCPLCNGITGGTTCHWCAGAGSIIYQPFHHDPASPVVPNKS